MKTNKDPRHLKRVQLMQELFSWDFQNKNLEDGYAKRVIAKIAEVDRMIAKAAPTWPIAKINKVDLAILRLAVAELTEKITPTKVVVDEAVELAKEYGAQSSPSFINGVLGKLIVDNELLI